MHPTRRRRLPAAVKGEYDHFYLLDEDHLCLTKQVMDEPHDAHTDGQNVLTMKKRL